MGGPGGAGMASAALLALWDRAPGWCARAGAALGRGASCALSASTPDGSQPAGGAFYGYQPLPPAEPEAPAEQAAPGRREGLPPLASSPRQGALGLL